jgi:hypothetical protein
VGTQRQADQQHTLRMSVMAIATEEFLDFIKRHGISFGQAAATRQAAGGAHNRRERGRLRATEGTGA